jgi:hypothetical protein
MESRSVQGRIPSLHSTDVLQTETVNALVRLTVSILLFAWGGIPAVADYSYLYVFGDGASGSTNGPGGAFYYGKRLSNGRVWPEVLAQWQGISYDSNKNWSYYGHYSWTVLTNLSNFTPPPDASAALYVLWACDADMVWNIQNCATNLTQWTTNVNQELTNHFKIITNLYYAKGIRTLIAPNAVDLIKVPNLSNYRSGSNFVRQQIISFNNRYAGLLSNAVATLPSLTIYTPDIFSLLENIFANPTNYGLIKPGTCVICDLPPSQWTLNGPGTNYVFWDDLDPTAMFHMWIADAMQRVVSPVRIGGITSLESSNQLDLVNVPIGRNGFIEGSGDFGSWTNVQSVDTNFAAQSVVLPLSGAQQFYRLQFPFSWTWP